MEGSSGRWDIDGVLEEVEMRAQDAVVSIHTTQAELVTRPASHSRMANALREIAKYKIAKGRRAEEDLETPENERVETSAMLVDSLWALATNCLSRRVDEKHMQVEAGREMSREARRRRDLYEGYAEQVSSRNWSRTRLQNLAEDPVTCPITGVQARDTEHATAIQAAVTAAVEACALKLKEAGTAFLKAKEQLDAVQEDAEVARVEKVMKQRNPQGGGSGPGGSTGLHTGSRGMFDEVDADMDHPGLVDLKKCSFCDCDWVLTDDTIGNKGRITRAETSLIRHINTVHGGMAKPPKVARPELSTMSQAALFQWDSAWARYCHSRNLANEKDRLSELWDCLDESMRRKLLHAYQGKPAYAKFLEMARAEACEKMHISVVERTLEDLRQTDSIRQFFNAQEGLLNQMSEEELKFKECKSAQH